MVFDAAVSILPVVTAAANFANAAANGLALTSIDG
jgi:hypothetical protein